jgi:protein-tyrosine phosphatase
MAGSWTCNDAGVMVLPSGRLVRGRALRGPAPAGPSPEFGLYLLGRRPPPVGWEHGWVRWPDFWLPADRDAFARQLRELLERSGGERVEVACDGGLGRTGTALACIAVLDGVPADRAVDYTREHYSARAVETPWQKRFVRRFRAHG